MKKMTKLAIAGVVAFVLVIVFFIYYIYTTPPYFADTTPYFAVRMPFVEEYTRANPNYRPTAELNIADIKLETVTLSQNGFSRNELSTSTVTSLRILNASDKQRNIIVTSPATDGSWKVILTVPISANGEIDLGLMIAPYAKEIITKSNAKIEKTPKGYKVFEISCTMNCNQENNYIVVYMN